MAAICPFTCSKQPKPGYPPFRHSPSFLRYAPERLYRRGSYPCRKKIQRKVSVFFSYTKRKRFFFNFHNRIYARKIRLHYSNISSAPLYKQPQILQFNFSTNVKSIINHKRTCFIAHP